MSRGVTRIVLPLLILFSFAGASPAAENVRAPARAGEAAQPVPPAGLFALMLVEAEKGDPKAMLQVGSYFENGYGVERNYGKTLEWYRKAADAGLAEGAYNVGVCYEVGMGTAVNLDRAVAQYRTAADRGLAQASYKLAGMYFSGQGLPSDPAKGLLALAKAADGGHPQALNDLGMVYLNGLFGVRADGGVAVGRFTAAAGAGSADAMRNLVFIFKDGLAGQAKNPVEALTWYLICKRAGFPDKLLPLEADMSAGLDEAARAGAARKADEWIAARQQKAAGAAMPTSAKP